METNSDLKDILTQSMAEGERRDVLTYGSIICLNFTEEGSSTSVEYFAYSEGLTDNKVLLKSKDEVQGEGSYSRSIFRVYPSFYHDAYFKGKEKFEEITKGGITTQLDKRGIIKTHKEGFLT